jgi:Domain of unknown function (DUF4340)
MVAAAMNKKYLKTLIALAVLAALWGVFVFLNRKPGAEPSAKTKPTQKLLPLKTAAIQSFTLESHQGEPITCKRDGKKWEIIEPKRLPADSSSVNGLLDSLTDATVNQVVSSNSADLKDFGLAPPAETIGVVSDSKPASFKLLLGDESPTGDAIYAQVAGNPRVISLASYMKASLEKSLFDLRDKRAITLSTDQINRIQVKAKGKNYTLVKNPEGNWDLDLPPAVRADHFTVSNLVDQLQDLSMKSVLADEKKDMSKYGFGNPAMTVRLSGSGETQTLILGKENENQYDAMNTALPTVFTLGSDFYTQFDKDPASLRAKDLFSFSAFDVRKVQITSPKGHWTFEKQKDKWKESAPASKEEASEKIQSLLDDLRDLSSQSFPTQHVTDLAAYGLTNPAYRFQVESGEKNQTETVEIAKHAGHLFARRTTDQVPSELGSKALDSINKDLGAL